MTYLSLQASYRTGLLIVCYHVLVYRLEGVLSLNVDNLLYRRRIRQVLNAQDEVGEE